MNELRAKFNEPVSSSKIKVQVKRPLRVSSRLFLAPICANTPAYLLISVSPRAKENFQTMENETQQTLSTRFPWTSKGDEIFAICCEVYRKMK